MKTESEIRHHAETNFEKFFAGLKIVKYLGLFEDAWQGNPTKTCVYETNADGMFKYIGFDDASRSFTCGYLMKRN